MATHGTNAHTQTINGNAAGAAKGRATQNLVALRATFPLFFALTVFDGHIDPRDQAASQSGVAEVFGGERRVAHGG